MKIRLGKGNVTAKEIADMCGGTLSVWGSVEDTAVLSVCTDSREAARSSLFAAIRGERVDGHNFIVDVLRAGATAVLCERLPDDVMKRVDSGCAIIVKDTVESLGIMAHKYRKSLNIKTVAVTGSVGKTTTKEFIASVIKSEKKTNKTAGNHNSLIGMPLTLLETSFEAEAAVFEMGMNHLGEIEKMSVMAQPDIAVITNIGSSHLEYLHTRENIAKAKLEIVDGMKEDGVLILNGDEPLLRNIDGIHQKILYVSALESDNDYYVSNVRHTHTESCFDISCKGKAYKDITLPFVGDHGVMDAAFSFAVGDVLGISEDGIRRGIADFHNADMRQNIYGFGGISIIEDCYNASPESTRAAISLLSDYADSADEKGRKIALIGDMLELGENEKEMHREVGRYIAESGLDMLFTFGPLAENIAIGAVEGGMRLDQVFSYRDLSNPAAMGDILIESIKKNDTVLFKASRSVGAERIIEYVKSNDSKFFRTLDNI